MVGPEESQFLHPLQAGGVHCTTAPPGRVTVRKVLLSGEKASPQKWTDAGKTAYGTGAFTAGSQYRTEPSLPPVTRS